MLSLVSTLIAQFGDGFQPPADTVVTPLNLATDTDGSIVIGSIEGTISLVIGLLTTLAGVFFIINFIVGAFNWVTAGGDSGNISKARDKMLQSLIGLIVVVLSYSIIAIIGTVIGIELLNLQAQFDNILLP